MGTDLLCKLCRKNERAYPTAIFCGGACSARWEAGERPIESTADDPIAYPKVPFPLKDNIVLLGRRGSEAHGTYIPPEDPNGIDDRDLMGIVVPPPEFYLGLHDWDHAEEINGVWDVVLYDIRKFVRLLMKQNPNVLSMLWVDQRDIVGLTSVGRQLREHRELFRHRARAYESFIGYAHGQLHRMTSGEHKGFMGAKRKALVDKYGFDTKNAAHMIRILHMGIEFMETGRMQVLRTWDLAMITDIKRGLWPLAKVQNYATERFEAMREAHLASVLPESIDEKVVTKLLVRLVQEHWVSL